MSDLLITYRKYLKQSHGIAVGIPVTHPADCEECGGRLVRPATAEELAVIDARVEKVWAK